MNLSIQNLLKVKTKTKKHKSIKKRITHFKISTMCWFVRIQNKNIGEHYNMQI